MSSRDDAFVVETPPSETLAVRAGLLYIVLLSCGHFAVDLYSSALGALQPLLRAKFHTSLAQAGILGGVLTFSASTLQPIYGYLSDRFHSRMFTVLAPAVAGVFIASLGLAPGYGWLLPLVFLGGVGVASFHPQGSARIANRAGNNQARAMAFFVTAGTLGFAVGPTYFSLFTLRFGLDRLLWTALPGVLVSLLLFAMPDTAPAPAHRRGRFDWRPLAGVWRPLVLLYSVVFVRSVLQVTCGQFLTLYLSLERGFTVRQANYVLSAYLAVGAIGGLVGGHLADRFGGRIVTLVSMALSAPLFLLFFTTTGWFSVASLLASGFALLLTMPVNVVMAQRLAPSQAGTVSALMMGFAWGTAGMFFIPMVGLAGDIFSLQTVLTSMTIFPVIGFVLTLKLPR
jgi:FSR family fosmidomycin resistance protein-like MFS transporter